MSQREDKSEERGPVRTTNREDESEERGPVRTTNREDESEERGPVRTTNKKELRGGRYVLVRTLGEGTQGETYEALDRGTNPAPAPDLDLAKKWERYLAREGAAPTPPSIGDVVAIKAFRVGKARAWKDVELAEREAKTLASLDHRRLPRYVEHFEEEGVLYLVMEKIEGESLAALRARKAPLSTADVVRMLEDIGETLRYLHGRAPAIVHRDIKPGNVIRRPDGSFALVDFGAVRDRLRPAGGSTVVGTFGFMAPEQFQGRASERSDVYGTGVTAIVMLTGIEPEDLPHDGLGIDVAAALPGAPPVLVRALAAMVEPDPGRRIGSIDEALALLRARPPAEKRTAPADEKKKEKQEREKPELSKRERRAMRKLEKDAARRRRVAARARRAPLVPRLLAQLALVIAVATVWLVVGALVPLLLNLLSLVFGARLRRAATRTAAGARHAGNRIGSAIHWLSGYRLKDAIEESPRVRIGGEPDRSTEEEAAEAEAHAEAEAEAEAEQAARGRRRSRR